MGVDIAKMKLKKEEEARKTAEQNARNSTRRVIRWKPKTGENKVRIMPPWSTDDTNPNANQFYREVYLHWNVGGEGSFPILCPVLTPHGPGGICEVCIKVAGLRATKDPTDMEVAKTLAARRSYDSNIVDLKRPVYKEEDTEEWEADHPGEDCPFTVGDTKIQVWTYGVLMFKDLLDIFTDVEISDLDTGRDLIVTREGTGRESTKYRVRSAPNPTAFKVQQIVLEEKLVNLDMLQQYKTSEEVKAILAGVDNSTPTKQLVGKSEDSDDSDKPEDVVAKKPPTVTKKKSVTAEELEAQLKALSNSK